jgi:hypothetical protein
MATAFNLAADVVLAIAAIPSLRDGAVAFDLPDLDGGHWFWDRGPPLGPMLITSWSRSRRS